VDGTDGLTRQQRRALARKGSRTDASVVLSSGDHSMGSPCDPGGLLRDAL
jgi:hypothetical protein